jgi:hypothetical protein
LQSGGDQNETETLDIGMVCSVDSGSPLWLQLFIAETLSDTDFGFADD